MASTQSNARGIGPSRRTRNGQVRIVRVLSRQQLAREHVDGAPGKECHGQAPTRLGLKLGDEIRRSHIQRYAAREREAMPSKRPHHSGEEHSGHRRGRERGRRSHRAFAARPGRQKQARNRDSFGNLVQHDREEHQNSERVAHGEATRDRDAVDESVQQQPCKRGPAHCLSDRVLFFAKVKVRRQRVLGEMHEEVAHEHHECGARSPFLDRVRDEVEQTHRDHEASRERQESVEAALAPTRPRRHCSGADDVGRASDYGVAERREIQVQPGIIERRSAIAAVDSDRFGAGARSHDGARHGFSARAPNSSSPRAWRKYAHRSVLE